MAARRGRALTIDTSSEEEPVHVADRRGPNGTPRSSTSWWTGPNGTPNPRSWLQSPRKWGQGYTPTNAAQGGGGGGDLTPNSKRKAAYFSTGVHKSGDELFGKEEDEEQQGEPTKPAAPVSLASVVHQTDKDGRQQQVAVPVQQQQAASSSSPSSSFLGRLLGRFSQLTVSETPATTTTAATGTSSAKPGAPTTAAASASTAAGNVAPQKQLLLGRPHPDDVGKKTLLLDLDETLVHSSFTPIDTADFVVPIKIEETWHQVYVTKRPGVDWFMQRVARHYEVVIFTASLSLYADPLLDILDVHRVVRRTLYREDCTFHQGCYVKDLGRIVDRDIRHTILVDNSPLSFMFQPENAVGCSSFIDDKGDAELEAIAAFLEDISMADDVRLHCAGWRQWEHKPRGPHNHEPHHHQHGKGKGTGKGGKDKRGYVHAG